MGIGTDINWVAARCLCEFDGGTAGTATKIGWMITIGDCVFRRNVIYLRDV